MTKVSASILIGAIVTMAAFAFMDYLITSDERAPQEVKPPIEFEIMQNRPDSDVEVKTRQLPEPPQPKAQPPRTQTSVPTEVTGPQISIGGPVIELDSTPINAQVFAPQDGDATPIVRVDPKYPTDAARDGKEGWVEMAFSIDKAGNVIDAQVINAEPKRIFNREALRALKKWKYRPKMENGQTIVQTGLQVVLEFKLQQ
ncbi:energy transducer TonB [Pseudoalteromonas phenolica O-BC30]|nr:energy transducer TonB [Pseudoalteromonas phenolica O-BC30]TMO54169.1 TonB system transport protein TonB [Pseudoalteromonas phenolica]